MLKRHRAPSPVPSPDPLLPTEPSLDVFDRVLKRRRQFAPPGANKVRGGDVNTGMSDEDDEDDSQAAEGFSEYTRGKSRWQEEAGLYKAANTLLHDLHAEHRHRAIFSSSSPHHYATSSDPYTRPDLRVHAAAGHEAGPSPHSVARTPPVPRHVENSRHEGSSEDANPWIGNPFPSDAEVQNVTQRYEDTNRLLGTLFLSRKRQLDIRDSANTS